MQESFIPGTAPEQRFLKLLIERRQTAFNDFYDRYAPALYGTIKKSLLNEDVSNETLVETFKLLWSRLNTYDPLKESLFIWASKIARQEINKQKIELVLKHLFSCKETDVILECDNAIY